MPLSTGLPNIPKGSFTLALEPPGQTQIDGVFCQFGFDFLPDFRRGRYPSHWDHF